MMPHSTLCCRTACLLLFLLSLAPAFAGSLATFAAKEMIGLQWPRTLVTYQVRCPRGQARPEAVRLVDADGKEQACQLWRVERYGDGSLAAARVSFYAELAPDGSYHFELLPGIPAAVSNAPKVIRTSEMLTLDNGITAIRLPTAGVRNLAKSVPLDTLPGPFQGIRLLDGRWTGGSTFEGENLPKATRFACRITEQGPLFAEAQVEYAFDNSGYYRFTARVLAGDPAVRVDEQMDAKTVGDMWQWRVVFNLAGEHWLPDAGYDIGATHRPPYLKANCPDRMPEPRLDDAFTALGINRKFRDNMPLPDTFKLAYDAPHRVAELHPWYAYGNAHYVGLVELKALAGKSDRNIIPFLAVVPMHAGSWRGASNDYEGVLSTGAGGRLALAWPLVAAPHPRSHLHTGEHDPAQPLTFRRRLWALVGGLLQDYAALYRFRENEGYLNLDQYKDWILDWKQDDRVSYPRLVFTRRDVLQWKDRLNLHPAGAELRKFLEFTPDPKRQAALWDDLMKGGAWHPGPRGYIQWMIRGGDGLSWNSVFRQAQFSDWVHAADELLSSPDLPAEQRHLLRQHIAAVCYLFADPDFNPRGTLIRMGNPNMEINRSFPLVYAAALIPDHPKAKEWLDAAEAMVRYQAIRNVAPSGSWSELISYFGAAGPTLMHGALVMQNAGRLDPVTARVATLPALHILQLLTPPDPRFGCRIAPAWGHEGVYLFNHWTMAAGILREIDPARARALLWAWDQQNRPGEQAHDDGFSPRSDIYTDQLNALPKGYLPPELASVWMPGFGAVLRAHAGDPEETYMSYRASYQHRGDASQNDFVLYAKGAPLVPMSMFSYSNHSGAYNAMLQSFGWYNRLRFGSRGNWAGWPSGGLAAQVHAHSFNASVDYLRSMGDYDPQHWTRQILFLKGKVAAGPNYFVFRESVQPQQEGAVLQPKWWALRTLGAKEQVAARADGFRYSSDFGAGLDVRFLQPATVAMESRDAACTGGLLDYVGMNWRRAHGMPAGTNVNVEEKITVTSVGPIAPDRDILVALYPQKKDEAAPRYDALADGAARITTGDGTDYVFLDRKPMTFRQDDIAFTGLAGAVRIYPDEVHLVIAEGPGEVSYRGVTLRSAVPVTRIIPLQQLKLQVIAVEPEPMSIRFSLDRTRGKIITLQPGVMKQAFPGGYAFSFESAEPITFTQDGVTFTGRRGGIEVNTRKKTVRLVLLDGERLGVGDLQVWGANGPYDLLFSEDRVSGKTAGVGRFLYLTAPAALNELPEVVIDGSPYAPGTSWGFIPPAVWDPPYYIPDKTSYDKQLTDMTVILPVLPGEHAVAVQKMAQPPIFRDWELW